MIDANDVPIYCFSFGNPDRKQRLEERFTTLGLNCNFIKPTEANELKESNKYVIHTGFERAYAVMEDHLRMIKYFYETGKPFGIMCEDDIYLRKSFKTDLPYIINEMKRLELDILLLGYLLPDKPYCVNGYYPFVDGSYSYHRYDNDLWGAEMYLITHAHAKYLLDKYTPQWASDNHGKHPFCSDWTITKDGNRAMIYPMLAVEEGHVNTDHTGQIDFHRRCSQFQYNPNYYI
jgi:hypothetical protein